MQALRKNLPGRGDCCLLYTSGSWRPGHRSGFGAGNCVKKTGSQDRSPGRAGAGISLSLIHISWFLLGGACAGGLVGALLLDKLKGEWVNAIFTLLIIASGIRMVF